MHLKPRSIRRRCAGINGGHAGMMPAHLPIIGETRTRIVAAYVWSLTHGGGEAAGQAGQ